MDPKLLQILAVVANTTLNPEAKGRTTTEKGPKDPYLFAQRANYATVLWCTTPSMWHHEASHQIVCACVWLLTTAETASKTTLD